MASNGVRAETSRGGLTGTRAPAELRAEGASPAVLALHGFGGVPYEVELVVNAARSLGLDGVCGAVRPGLRADLAIWDLPHENAIVQPWGAPRVRAVLRDGEVIAAAG